MFAENQSVGVRIEIGKDFVEIIELLRDCQEIGQAQEISKC